MRGLIFAAFALILLVAPPAWADWGPTRWGMTPEEVIKAIPFATPVTGTTAANDIGGLRQMLAAEMTHEGFDGVAEFYFDPATRRLGGMRFKLADPGQCIDYANYLIGNFGEGERTFQTPRGGGTIVTLRWGGFDGIDRYSFSQLAYDNGAAFMCVSMVKPPE